MRQSAWTNGSDYEVIVVDDGSTDATPDVLATYGDAIRVVRKANGGQASAFAAGLQLAGGDIVMFLDGDDWWHEDKVARVLAAFAERPDLVAVGHGITIVDELSGERQDQRPPAPVLLDLKAGDDAVAQFHSNMSFLGTSRLAARRAALEAAGMPPLTLTYEADEHFFTLLPAIGPVQVIDECLTSYRLHGNNLYQASNSIASSALTREKVAKRARIFRCLVDTLPVRLAEQGVPRARADAIMAPMDVAASRLELTAFGGRRSDTLAVETKAQDLLCAQGIGGHPAKRAAVRLAAMLLPPRLFYALRNRHAGAQGNQSFISA